MKCDANDSGQMNFDGSLGQYKILKTKDKTYTLFIYNKHNYLGIFIYDLNYLKKSNLIHVNHNIFVYIVVYLKEIK